MKSSEKFWGKGRARKSATVPPVTGQETSTMPSNSSCRASTSLRFVSPRKCESTIARFSAPSLRKSLVPCALWSLRGADDGPNAQFWYRRIRSYRSCSTLRAGYMCGSRIWERTDSSSFASLWATSIRAVSRGRSVITWRLPDESHLAKKLRRRFSISVVVLRPGQRQRPLDACDGDEAVAALLFQLSALRSLPQSLKRRKYLLGHAD